jgi:hypothetical protein
MRRTQLYMDDELWKALHLEARMEKTTSSDLVRRAVRDRYSREKRRVAMTAFAGIWKNRSDLGDTEEYVRNLRNDDRLERLKEL